jgi:hypothetical protein
MIAIKFSFYIGGHMKILECSSKGDKRFSAFYAKITAWKRFDSIENHYQTCKRFDDFVPIGWQDGKGREPTHIELNGKRYDKRFLSQWYKMLWVNYLDNNPELVEYARGFDDFNDIFKGKSQNCQADVIRQYIKQGRQSLVDDYQELMDLFKTKTCRCGGPIFESGPISRCLRCCKSTTKEIK